MLLHMVNADRKIAELIRNYAAARAISVSYASRLITGSGDTVSRIERGTSLTARRAERIRQRASDRWPDDLPWPPEIERPDGAMPSRTRTSGWRR